PGGPAGTGAAADGRGGGPLPGRPGALGTAARHGHRPPRRGPYDPRPPDGASPGPDRRPPRTARRDPRRRRRARHLSGRWVVKLRRRKERVSLDSRLDALVEAASLGEGRVAAEAVAAARAVAERAGVRRRLSVEHTVVALAGATGSGKSSLFNVIAGEGLAAVGVTRPTTATA